MGVRTHPPTRAMASAANAPMMLPVRMVHPLSFVSSLPQVTGGKSVHIDGPEVGPANSYPAVMGQPSGDEETIGQRLRRLRLARGLSQRELSVPGVSYAYISRIEAGQRQPSVKALRKLAPRLGVSVDYLETGSEIGNDQRLELRLSDAELALRLADGAEDAGRMFREIADEAVDAGES